MNFSSFRKQITLEDRSLSYLDVGTGPVLLMGHSYLWDAAMWAPQVEYLCQNYRCIVTELWGHGHSGLLPEGTESLKGIAEHMLQLMDKLNIREFSIIGLSIGGMWGSELTLLAPERIKALVLMDTFIGPEPEASRTQFTTMIDAIELAKAVPEPLVETLTPIYFAPDTPKLQPELISNFKQSLRDFTPDAIDTIVKIGRMIFARRDLLQQSKNFDLPCLIMTGSEDMPRPVSEGLLMHHEIKDSQFVEVPSAGHIVTLEQAEFVNQQLQRFLETHLPGH